MSYKRTLVESRATRPSLNRTMLAEGRDAGNHPRRIIISLLSETKAIAFVAFLVFLIACIIGAYLAQGAGNVDLRYLAAGGVGLSLSAWAASRSTTAGVSPLRERLFRYATFLSNISAAVLLFLAVKGSSLTDPLIKTILLPGFACSPACAIESCAWA
jgi:hypothetical protein